MVDNHLVFRSSKQQKCLTELTKSKEEKNKNEYNGK